MGRALLLSRYWSTYPWSVPYNVKQGGIKYYFLCFWYDSVWDWTPVSPAIDEHSTHSKTLKKQLHKNIKSMYHERDSLTSRPALKSKPRRGNVFRASRQVSENSELFKKLDPGAQFQWERISPAVQLRQRFGINGWARLLLLRVSSHSLGSRRGVGGSYRTQAARGARLWFCRGQHSSSVSGWEACDVSRDSSCSSNGDLDDAKEGIV